MLQQTSARLNIELRNVGFELERRLAATPSNKLGFSAGKQLREIADKERTDTPLLLDDFPPHQQTRAPPEGASLKNP